MKFKSDIEVQAGIKDYAGSSGTSGQVLSSDGATVSWIDAEIGVARDVQNRVKAGVAINKGQAVYVTSADGTNIIVGLASNTSEATSSKTLGLLNATVAANGMADVVQIGKLTGLNTIGAVVGDPVWLGTNGNLIYGLANKPYAPAHLVYIGVVTRVNANNGEIFITVQNGFELDELHNVSARNPVNNDLLAYTGAPVNLWETKSLGTVIGGTASQFVKGDGSLDNNAYVTIGTTQTITGTKTFLDNITYFSNNGSYSIELSNPDDLTSVLRIGASAGAGNITSDGALGINVGGTISAIGIAANGSTFFSNTITAPAFKTYAGTSSQFLKANGTVDSTVYVPTTRTITINGVTQSLAANQTWTVAGGIDGSGTANYISKFIDVDTIGISPIFDLNGNIGIGTITPTTYAGFINLSVGGSSRGIVSIRNNANNEVGFLYNQFGNVLTLESVLDNLKLTSAANKDIIFSTSGANERVRITSTGTTSISNNAALGTAGTNFIAYAYDSDSYFSLGNNTNDSLNLQLRRSNSDVMFSVDGHSGLTIIKGNTLIGAETDAGYKLDVAGVGRFSGSRSIIISGGTSGIIEINGDGTTYATGILFKSQEGGTALSGIFNYGSGTTQQWLAIGGTAYNNAAMYIVPSGVVRIATLAGSGTRVVTADSNGNLSTTPGSFAPRYTSTISVSNSTYTNICTISGDALASAVKMSFQGTSDSVVVNTTAEILVNHSQDISVTSNSGFYSQLNIRVISDNNSSYSIEAQVINGITSTGLNIEVFPLNNESVTFQGTLVTTGSTLVHTTRPGIYISSTGGNSGDISAAGNIYAGGSVGIGTITPIDKLNVVGGITSTGLSDPSSTNVGSLQIGYDGTNGRVRTWNSSPLIYTSYNYQAWETSASERMRIFANGNVNIGNGSTDAGYKLDVNGNARVKNELKVNSTNYPSTYVTRLASDSGEGILQLGNNGPNYILAGNSSLGGYLEFRTNVNSEGPGITSGTLALTLDATGRAIFNNNVGLSITNPRAALQIDRSSWAYTGATVSRMLQKNVGSAADYEQHVILLHPIYNGTLIGYNKCSGTIYATRGGVGNGLINDTYHLDTASAYNSFNGTINSTIGYGRLFTCLYGGVKYMALLPDYRTSAVEYDFDGYIKSTGEELKVIVYRMSNSGTIVNSEVYNSLTAYGAGVTYYQGDIYSAGAITTIANSTIAGTFSFINLENNSSKLQVGRFLAIQDNASNVGIGYNQDSVPFGDKFSVNGSSYFNGILKNTANATFGLGANRPVTYDSNGGNFRIKANAGGWATGYFFDGSSGTYRGGFGAYGDANSLIYYWIGSDYNIPTMIVQPSQGNVMIGTTTDAGYKLDVNGNVRATGFFNSSDIRLKEIVDYDYSVSDIKPISYLWKDLRDNKKHIGYSAQEVQKVMPDAVNEDTDGMLSVNYIEVLVAKIAELENRIKQLEK